MKRGEDEENEKKKKKNINKNLFCGVEATSTDKRVHSKLRLSS